MVVVIDTNVIISAAIIKDSVPDQAVRKAFINDTVIRSLATPGELWRTLTAKKFDRYFRDKYERDLFIYRFAQNSKLIQTFHHVDVCRDRDDNKYLELALSGNASCIITGDPDLLSLHPFKDIPIVSARMFLLDY